MDVGRNLLEDKSDTEETHWGRGLDSNVKRVRRSTMSLAEELYESLLPPDRKSVV